MADGTLISTKSFYGRTVKTDIVENQHIRDPVVLEPGSSEKESSDEEDELDQFPSSGSEYKRSEEELSESELYMSEIEADMSNEVLGEQQASAKTQIPGSVTINLKQSSVTSKSKERNIQEMKTRWRKRTSPKFDVNFKGQELPPPPKEALNPVDYFKQFFSEDLIQHIAEQTNLYSVQQTGASIQTSKSEMEQYIGILIMMSIIKLPQIRISLPLLQHLTKKKIWVVATVRKDRMKGAQHHLQSEKELKRNGRCSSDSVVEANSGITVVRWMDNGIVQLISNYMSGEDGPAARRWCKKEREYVQIERPLIIHEYNIHMGGVDLCDMLLSLYSPTDR
eukprot:gene3858-biopygen1962